MPDGNATYEDGYLAEDVEEPSAEAAPAVPEPPELREVEIQTEVLADILMRKDSMLRAAEALTKDVEEPSAEAAPAVPEPPELREVEIQTEVLDVEEPSAEAAPAVPEPPELREVEIQTEVLADVEEPSAEAAPTVPEPPELREVETQTEEPAAPTVAAFEPQEMEAQMEDQTNVTETPLTFEVQTEAQAASDAVELGTGAVLEAIVKPAILAAPLSPADQDNRNT
eukprot:Skav208062  [mRNA]  locus=scaffold936:45510:52900:- [translate_table: standard]